MDAMYASMVPSLADDEGFRRWFKTYFRLAASPAAALELDRAAMETDIREILPAIRMPTLVLYLASHRLPATSLRGFRTRRPLSCPESTIGWPTAISSLVRSRSSSRECGGRRTYNVSSQPSSSRTLSARPSELPTSATEPGDLLEMHHTLVRRELEQHRGREVNTTGDGFLPPARSGTGDPVHAGDPQRSPRARGRSPSGSAHRRVRGRRRESRGHRGAPRRSWKPTRPFLAKCSSRAL